MTIGIDASRANEAEKTGVGWYAWHMIEGMKKSLPETVRVILYSDTPLHGDLAVLPSHWTSRVLHWPPRRLWTQCRLSLEMLLHPPDVLFVPAHVVPIVHPKKTVMTVHDIAAVQFPESYSWFERWYTLWSARSAIKKLWRVIVPSQFVKDELLKKFNVGNPMSEISIIPHGYDPRYGTPVSKEKKQEVLKKYGIQPPYILSVGRLETKKNTRRMVEAFTVVSNTVQPQTYHLVLIGQPGHGYPEVARTILTSPYRDRIITPGWVAPEDLVPLMQAAAVFVFPSLAEGFGIPVLEAFAAGTPVVAACGTSLPEVAGGAALLVDPEQGEGIASGILTMLEDEATRDRFIREGRERVLLFSWQAASDRTARVLCN